MYEYISGMLTKVNPKYIVLDNQGVCYQIYVPNPYNYRVNDYYTVWVYQSVREDSIDLYGFLTFEEKDLFLSTWVNCPDDEKLKNILIDKFKLTSMEAKDALKNIQLISDYAPVGKSAMKILLECIEQQRVTWTEAILLCEKEGKLTSLKEEKEYDLLPYYGQVLPDSTVALMGKFWHSSFSVKSKAKGFTKPNTSYEEEKYGKIANPVVHQTLNELRKANNMYPVYKSIDTCAGEFKSYVPYLYSTYENENGAGLYILNNDMVFFLF